MKKKKLNKLKLNKSVISNLNLSKISGGKLFAAGSANGLCPDLSKAGLCETDHCPDTCNNSFAPGCVCSENVC